MFKPVGDSGTELFTGEAASGQEAGDTWLDRMAEGMTTPCVTEEGDTAPTESQGCAM